jgi:hypothetical protein
MAVATSPPPSPCSLSPMRTPMRTPTRPHPPSPGSPLPQFFSEVNNCVRVMRDTPHLYHYLKTQSSPDASIDTSAAVCGDGATHRNPRAFKELAMAIAPTTEERDTAKAEKEKLLHKEIWKDSIWRGSPFDSYEPPKDTVFSAPDPPDKYFPWPPRAPDTAEVEQYLHEYSIYHRTRKMAEPDTWRNWRMQAFRQWDRNNGGEEEAME